MPKVYLEDEDLEWRQGWSCYSQLHPIYFLSLYQNSSILLQLLYYIAHMDHLYAKKIVKNGKNLQKNFTFLSNLLWVISNLNLNFSMREGIFHKKNLKMNYEKRV